MRLIQKLKKIEMVHVTIFFVGVSWSLWIISGFVPRLERAAISALFCSMWAWAIAAFYKLETKIGQELQDIWTRGFGPLSGLIQIMNTTNREHNTALVVITNALIKEGILRREDYVDGVEPGESDRNNPERAAPGVPGPMGDRAGEGKGAEAPGYEGGVESGRGTDAADAWDSDGLDHLFTERSESTGTLTTDTEEITR